MACLQNKRIYDNDIHDDNALEDDEHVRGSRERIMKIDNYLPNVSVTTDETLEAHS